MKTTKTVKKNSCISFWHTHSSFRAIESFFRKHSEVYLDGELSRYRESFSNRYSYYGYLVTVSSYAQGVNKSISQAARDIMELVNDGDLKYVTTVNFIHYFEWAEDASQTSYGDKVEPTPADLMLDLDELKQVDSVAKCDDVKIETSIDYYLRDNLGSGYRLSKSPKERKIILLDLIMALFNEIQTNRDGQNIEHLTSKIEELNFCYKSILEMNKEVRKHRASKSKSQSCYAFYDLKQSPPKFIGVGITGGDPYAFIKKTLRFSIDVMRQVEWEFDARPVDDNSVINEINRITKEYKPYTKFLLAHKGNFYASERFSTFIRGIEDSDKTSFLGRMAPVKVKTEILNPSDYIWKWENRPRVISDTMDYWSSQAKEEDSNQYATHHRYSDDEIKALNTNYFILTENMKFSDFPNKEGVELEDIFKGCNYKLENGCHTIGHNCSGSSLEIKISNLAALVSTVLMTHNGRVEVSAKLNYNNEDVEPDRPIYWVELYEMVKMFIASPSPLDLSSDIYLPPGEKHTERDVLEAILNYNFTFHAGNFFRSFFFDVEMID